MPKTSSEDRLAATIEDLSHVLKNPHLKIPFLEQGTPTNDAIRKIQAIFNPSLRDAAAPPRVIETTKATRVQPARKARSIVPRVNLNSKKIDKIIEEAKRYPVGTILIRNSKGRIVREQVVSYDKDRK